MLALKSFQGVWYPTYSLVTDLDDIFPPQPVSLHIYLYSPLIYSKHSSLISVPGDYSIFRVVVARYLDDIFPKPQFSFRVPPLLRNQSDLKFSPRGVQSYYVLSTRAHLDETFPEPPISLHIKISPLLYEIFSLGRHFGYVYVFLLFGINPL